MTEPRKRSRSGGAAGFRVVPQTGSVETTFLVLSPAGIGLYSFTDLHAAAAAAELNSAGGTAR
jgi:hypothetical protein